MNGRDSSSKTRSPAGGPGDQHREPLATDAESIRSRLGREEAFVKAAGQFHCVYGLVVLALTVYLAASVLETAVAVEAAQGQLRGRVYWDSLIGCIAALGVSNFLAGCGLRRLRGWAFRAEYVIILLIFAVFALVTIRALQGVSSREIVVDVLFTSLATSPVCVLIGFLLLGGARRVATPGYRTIVTRTREIKVRPTFPAAVGCSIFLVPAGLAVCYWIAVMTLVCR